MVAASVYTYVCFSIDRIINIIYTMIEVHGWSIKIAPDSVIHTFLIQ